MKEHKIIKDDIDSTYGKIICYHIYSAIRQGIPFSRMTTNN